MDKLYHILEISHRATQEEIKASYRRLAKLYHPDTNPHASQEKTEHFQKIRDAYGILSNPEQRSLYDQGNITCDGKKARNAGPKPSNPFKGFNMDDLFTNLNRRPSANPSQEKTSRTPQPEKKDHDTTSFSLKLSFEESCLGAKKMLTIKGMKRELVIPPGVTNKSTLELSFDKETQSKAFITLYVASHPSLQRENQHLQLDLPITLSESVSGGKVEIPTLQGPVMLKIPPATRSGHILTLKGKGIPGKNPGDLHIKIIITPPEEANESLKESLKNWEKSNPYNPRGF